MAPLQQILTWQGQKIFVAKLKYQKSKKNGIFCHPEKKIRKTSDRKLEKIYGRPITQSEFAFNFLGHAGILIFPIVFEGLT
ncbi:transmembrane protein, putative [Medicago truncatula]|uniref:Transmembrane protein, putative n=1 Tax=Medicago truncatula TaxID=3880 RepID=A0A072VAX9_MEDTR|nr:transmembrane protein, putative [Medicago truncatula]